MAKENETIADIIAEKRREANYIVQVSKGKCQTRRDKAEDEARDIRREANRLEAAYKREIDVLKQRCAELNAEVAAKDEVIKRLDAEIRKYQEERELRIAAQKAKAAAEGYADGKRDAAKLREALEYPKDTNDQYIHIGDAVHMLNTGPDGDHEWDDIVLSFEYVGKGGGDDWLVYGENGAAWACECEVLKQEGGNDADK